MPRPDDQGLRVAFAAAVVRLRLARGISQGALSELVGVDRATITRFENGERLPSLPVLIALGDVLRVPADELLGRERIYP